MLRRRAFQCETHAEIQALPVGQRHYEIRDALRRVLFHNPPATVTIGCADARIQQAQIVVDLRDGPDGRPGIPGIVFLTDRQRRADAFDVLNVRPVDALEKLPRIGG